jgi:thiamine-monophosphate kinase
LLFTAPVAAKVPRRIAGVAVTAIGRIVPMRVRKPRVMMLWEGAAKALEPHGWQHFS